MSTASALADAVSTALGAPVVGLVRLGGGDVAESFAVDLEGGRRIFAKTHRQPPPDFFDTEARGLRWLGEADAIRIPEVLAWADLPVPFLALGWIDEAPRRLADEAAFGRALAGLHRAGTTSFGRADRRTTGSRRLPNEPTARWPDFYGSQRLTPLARLSAEANALPGAVIAQLERLAGRLDRFDTDEPAARLHGDLWAGNRLVDGSGTSWLIDPAAHGGHREFDLAMMRLFGGFGEAAFDAYDDAHPLAAGWEDRIALHQIAPLVVHAIKFGGGYVAAATDAIGRYS